MKARLGTRLDGETLSSLNAPPIRLGLLTKLNLLSVGLIVATALVAPSVPEYAAPVSPAFLMLAAVGLVGVPLRHGRVAAAGSWRSIAGSAVGVGAAAWALKLYYDAISGNAVSDLTSAPSFPNSPNAIGNEVLTIGLQEAVLPKRLDPRCVNKQQIRLDASRGFS